MKKLNSKGFGVIGALIIVLVVGLAGGGAYYVSQKESAPTSTQTQPATGKKDSLVIPEGFIKYTNEDIGIGFAYPQEWGKTSVSKNSYVNTASKTGKTIRISFSKSENIYVQANTKDFSAATEVSHAPYGYIKEGAKYYSAAEFLGDEKYSLNDNLIKTKEAKGHNITGIVYSYNDQAFTDSYITEASFNLKNSEYSGLGFIFSYDSENSLMSDQDKSKVLETLHLL